MAHSRKRPNPLFLLPALLLFSCAGLPEPQSPIYENSIFTPESSVPGTLLEAEALGDISSGKARLTLAMASPLMIGTQVKMDVLEKAGYAAWRASRLNTLSDIRQLRIVFTARSPGGGCERQSGTIVLPAALPSGTRELTWLIVAKGTEMRRDFTPSRGKGVEMPFIATAAALGYAVWVPDYSGLGDGQGIHAYCVA